MGLMDDQRMFYDLGLCLVIVAFADAFVNNVVLISIKKVLFMIYALELHSLVAFYDLCLFKFEKEKNRCA